MIEEKYLARIKTYKENPGKFYPKDYFEMHFNRFRQWEIWAGEQFCSNLKITSVVDLGCAVGSYLEGFLKVKCEEVKGYEYMLENSKLYTPNNVLPYILFGDLTKPLEIKKYDCALSIEVAEHLPPEYGDQFVDNLCNASNKYIILTAAQPGQGSKRHINLQPLEFWIRKIEKKDFKLLKEKTSFFKDLFMENIDKKYKTNDKWIYKRLKHIPNNLLIFKIK